LKILELPYSLALIVYNSFFMVLLVLLPLNHHIMFYQVVSGHVLVEYNMYFDFYCSYGYIYLKHLDINHSMYLH